VAVTLALSVTRVGMEVLEGGALVSVALEGVGEEEEEMDRVGEAVGVKEGRDEKEEEEEADPGAPTPAPAAPPPPLIVLETEGEGERLPPPPPPPLLGEEVGV
jgi:hypothetical protein